MKRIIAGLTLALALCAFHPSAAKAQTPGWQYTQCTLIPGVTLTSSFQKIATCISAASWPFTLSTSWTIFPVGVLDVTEGSSPADVNLEISATIPTGGSCAHTSSGTSDYARLITGRRQLWPVTETLTLNGGKLIFPTGCEIDLYAMTSSPLHAPTLNEGSSDGTNLALIAVNQPK